MEAVLKTSATLEAESQILVVSEAARRVQELLVEEGDRVQEECRPPAFAERGAA